MAGYSNLAAGTALEGCRAPNCAAVHLVLDVQHVDCKVLWIFWWDAVHA